MKPVQWIVFKNGDQILCVKDTHRGEEKELRERGAEILGNPSMETPKDAIDYIKDIRGIR